MATQLTIQSDASTESDVPAASEMYWDNSSGQVLLFVKNGSGGVLEVTVTEQRTCSFGHEAQNFTAELEIDETATLGPFDLLRFNDSNRRANVSFDVISSVTVAAFSG